MGSTYGIKSNCFPPHSPSGPSCVCPLGRLLPCSTHLQEQRLGILAAAATSAGSGGWHEQLSFGAAPELPPPPPHHQQQPPPTVPPRPVQLACDGSGMSQNGSLSSSSLGSLGELQAPADVVAASVAAAAASAAAAAAAAAVEHPSPPNVLLLSELDQRKVVVLG